MLLRPRNSVDNRLDPARLRAYDEELVYIEGNDEAVLTLKGRRLWSASCWWDPSYGSPDRGDGSVVAAVFTDGGGDYWLHRIRYLVHDPSRVTTTDEATQLCRQVVALAKELLLPAVLVETNGIGRFLPGLLRQELAASGVRCSVIERTSRSNKDLRIVDAFDAVLAAGRLWAHRSVWNTPFVEEMRDWRPGGKGRDDGLDAVAGCLLNEPVRLPRVVLPAANARPVPSWRGGGANVRAAVEFEV
jgi:hypothetical protein